MSITNQQSGTNVHEIADGIYRINTPVEIEGGAQNFVPSHHLAEGSGHGADFQLALELEGVRNVVGRPVERQLVDEQQPLLAERHRRLDPLG